MNETRTGDGPVGAANTQTASLNAVPAGQGAPWWHEHTLWDKRMSDLRIAMEHVIREAEAACRRFPPLNSLHEGLGVLLEEGKEFLDEVHANDTAKAKLEAKQIAAVALRIIAEVKFR